MRVGKGMVGCWERGVNGGDCMRLLLGIGGWVEDGDWGRGFSVTDCVILCVTFCVFFSRGRVV